LWQAAAGLRRIGDITNKAIPTTALATSIAPVLSRP